ncbi:MAG TPA: peptide ABC transporter substrate-binding protein [Steroidobacteraceae bacterium]|jgi:oligopeptide transport system substrate-binding protein
MSFLAIICLFLGLSSCGNQANTSPQGQILRRGLAGEPASLDPAAAADNFSFQLLQDLYEGLTIESASGQVLPGVASSWSVDDSGTEYTFRLRDGAHWSNGQPVRAQEFVFAWRRVLDPTRGSPVSDDLRLISGAPEIIAGRLSPNALGVYAPSDKVLVVKLERPAPYLPQILTHSATFPVYSEASARSHSPNTWVSNGPYVLLNWVPGTKLELGRNPNYWDGPNVHIAKVEYKIASDQNSQLSQYRAGELDITDIVPANAIPWIRAQHSNELVVAPFLATAYFGLNLSAPALASNGQLRKALAMAIDRKRIAAAQGFGQPPAYGFVPPGTWNYTPQQWPWSALSDADRIAEAKRLYASSGYSLAKPLRIRLLFNSNIAIKQTAILIAAMWKEALGIDTELTEEEYRVFLQSRHDKTRWEVARLGWTADFNDASNFLDTFRGNSPNNDAGYSNSSYDALLDAAARTADLDTRRQLLEAAERVMLGDYPILPLYFFVSKRLVKPYVHGVQLNPLDRLTSKTLSMDH